MHRARQVQGWRLRDLDGFLHGSQQAVPSLPPQGRSKTLWTTNEQLDHNTGVLLDALACSTNVTSKEYRHKRTYIINVSKKIQHVNTLQLEHKHPYPQIFRQHIKYTLPIAAECFVGPLAAFTTCLEREGERERDTVTREREIQ